MHGRQAAPQLLEQDDLFGQAAAAAAVLLRNRHAQITGLGQLPVEHGVVLLGPVVRQRVTLLAGAALPAAELPHRRREIPLLLGESHRVHPGSSCRKHHSRASLL